MKKFYSLVAIATLSLSMISQAQETFTYRFATQGFANAQDIRTGNIIANRITYEALGNGSTNTPKYYTTGTNMTLYSSNSDGNGNSFELKTVGTIKMTSVKFKADSFGNNQYAPISAIITVDGVVVPTVKDTTDASIYVINTTNPASRIMIKNGNLGTVSAQIRIQEIEVTYEGVLAAAEYSQVSKAVSNTLWSNTASFNVRDKTLVEVYNMNGQLVKSFEVNGIQNINVSSLAKGTYVVKTISNGTTSTQKVVKK